jgi:large subunit ribosomal protein L3
MNQEIIRVKTEEKDGYNAIVIWWMIKEKEGVKKYRYVREFKVDSLENYKAWDEVSFDIIKDLEQVRVKGTTKWKWYQWVIKRFGFAGLSATHGNKYTRHPWSIGNRKPRRVNKNHPLPWHMWNLNITVKNVKIIAGHEVNGENILVVNWSLPGWRNSLIKVYL